jgi:hypothetical protein
MEIFRLKGVLMNYTNKKKYCWSCHKEINNIENESNYICPHTKCNAKYADKPKNEAILHILQEEYLLTRDNKIFGRMLLMIKDIAYNQICNKLKQSGKFLLEEELEDKVGWTIEKFVTLYSNPNFRITTSFIDYTASAVLYPLYNYKLQDKEKTEISLFTPIYNNKHSSSRKENTLYDIMKETPVLEEYGAVENYFFLEIQKENTIDMVNDFVDTLIKNIYNKKGLAYTIKMITLFDFFIQKRNNKLFTSWWNVEGLEFKKVFEKILLLFRNTLRESSCG